MKRHSHTTFLALSTAALASFAWGQTPPENQTEATDPAAPSAASSPHQRQSTTTQATEAATPSKTDPSASSTPHQESATRTAQTTQSEGETQRLVDECVAKLKARDKGIPDYNAKKACRDHVRKQGESEG